MGNFYTNFTVRGKTPAVVARVLEGRSAFVSSNHNGCVVVYDQECEDQDSNILTSVGKLLSRDLRCPVLAALNHDDDILVLKLFDCGSLVDEYNSSPGYFDPESEDSTPSGGDVKTLCVAFGVNCFDALEAVLRSESDSYLFAFERHAEIVRLLGMSSYAVGSGYQYVAQGELPNGLGRADLISVT